jgi:hypothetical protein
MQAPIEPFPDEVIVVKLWEIYLRGHSHNLSMDLCHLSIDHGPFEKYSANERLTFRFKRQMWEERVKGLLYENRVPVVIKSNHFFAVQIKGAAIARL